MIDDIGAVVVIAIFYGSGISPQGFVIVGAGIGAVLVMRTAGVRSPLLFVVPGIVVWAGLLMAGLHPTIGGVVLGLLTPVLPWFGPSGFAATTQQQLEQLPSNDRVALLSSLDLINQARREAVSPTERLIHGLHPWVALVVMPIFALANAGVVFGGGTLSGDYVWLFAGVVAGLALGKPLGIAVAALGASRLGIATRSAEITRPGILLVGMVGGIGFTMSLFIAQLAFPPGPLLDTAKLAILAGSGVAIIVGMAFGFLMSRR